MKTTKYIALLAVATIGFTACDDDDDYSAGEAYNNAGLTFSTSNKSSVEIKPSETQYSLILNRLDSENAATYNINVTTNEDNSFVVPATIAFDKGSTTAELAIGISENMVLDEEKTLSLSISDADINPYAVGSSTFTIGITRSTWATLGNAYIYDTFTEVAWNEKSGVEALDEVVLQQNQTNANKYRITYPYSAEDGAETQTYIEFILSDDQTSVTWDSFWYTGVLYQSTVGYDVKAYLPSALKSSLEDESEVFVDENGNLQYFIVNPYFYVDGLGGWGNYKVYVSFPSFDLAALLFASNEEEEEEESGQDFAYGASITDYVGNYTIKYYSAYAKDYIEESVSISADGDNVTISAFNDGIELIGVYSKGLLYFGYQELAVDDEVLYIFPATTEEIFDEAYLYAGFDDNGVLKIKNYPYNGKYLDDDEVEQDYPALTGFYILNSEYKAYDYIGNISLTPDENKSANKSLKATKVASKLTMPIKAKNAVHKAPQTIAAR